MLNFVYYHEKHDWLKFVPNERWVIEKLKFIYITFEFNSTYDLEWSQLLLILPILIGLAELSIRFWAKCAISIFDDEITINFSVNPNIIIYEQLNKMVIFKIKWVFSHFFNSHGIRFQYSIIGWQHSLISLLSWNIIYSIYSNFFFFGKMLGH